LAAVRRRERRAGSLLIVPRIDCAPKAALNPSYVCANENTVRGNPLADYALCGAG
jgi:hypothetical protein